MWKIFQSMIFSHIDQHAGKTVNFSGSMSVSLFFFLHNLVMKELNKIFCVQSIFCSCRKSAMVITRNSNKLRVCSYKFSVPTPLVVGGTIYSNGFSYQTILADRYIHRREMWVVSFKSSSNLEFKTKKVFF